MWARCAPPPPVARRMRPSPPWTPLCGPARSHGRATVFIHRVTSPTGPSGEFYRCLRYPSPSLPLSLPRVMTVVPPLYANAQHLHPSLALYPPPSVWTCLPPPTAPRQGTSLGPQAVGHESTVAFGMRPPGPRGTRIPLRVLTCHRSRATNPTAPFGESLCVVSALPLPLPSSLRPLSSTVTPRGPREGHVTPSSCRCPNVACDGPRPSPHPYTGTLASCLDEPPGPACGCGNPIVVSLTASVRGDALIGPLRASWRWAHTPLPPLQAPCASLHSHASCFIRPVPPSRYAPSRITFGGQAPPVPRRVIFLSPLHLSVT